MIDRLHVSPKILTALIFLVEYPLEFPFSSAMLIRSTGYFYYRSSGSGKYPTKWTDLARKRGTLPSILDTGTNFSRKAAPHLASFIDVL